MKTNCYAQRFFLTLQAFDRVWHTGLFYQIKKYLPGSFYPILKSYLEDRYFQVNFQDTITNLHQIKAGVPQGSVLGPILYLLFTSDFPIIPQVTVATYADDTAIIATSENPVIASQLLQSNLNRIQNWLMKWRIKINESKCAHITFTTRKDNCPPFIHSSLFFPLGFEGAFLRSVPETLTN